MNYNYHAHTHRCGHATGTEEEYILRAIENGIEKMGFSDHIPLKFRDGTESFYRVPVNRGREYCEKIASLGEKYKDKIEIRVGFEAEYYAEYFDEMVENAIACGGEYLILGQHFNTPDNICEYSNNSGGAKDAKSCEQLSLYVKNVITAMEKKVFTYVAHPDMFRFEGDIKIYREQMRNLCIASRELNVPLEINFLGIRDNRHYPRGDFWELAGEEKSPVTFGFDAHDVESAFDGDSLLIAKKLVEGYKLNYIGEPMLNILR